jgi:GR25 family glycosyltransferase involved in LPS biosynthesis
MKSLFYSYDLSIESAYIIRIKDNDTSEILAERCAKSCDAVEQKYTYWDAYDGTRAEIKKPNHHNVAMDMLKVIDHYATKTEISCALSHISLWVQCMLLDKPIVILEHDAVMLKKYNRHQVFNSIGFLGSREQLNDNWPVSITPLHNSEGPNYHFICRAHAYSIDPVIAKNLYSYVLQNGIFAPLDIMIRADIFSFHQTDLFAYDDSPPGVTTILGRPKTGRSTIINDRLKL